MTTRISPLDESSVLGRGLTLQSADNATILLRDSDGATGSYTDLMSAYGAVNFGHLNPLITPSLDLTADIAAGVYPPEAAAFADWLTDRLGLPGHQVLFQVGGSFAVSSALAIAQRVRPGKVLALEGAFHGLGLDALAATRTHRELALQNTVFTEAVDPLVTHLRPGAEFSGWEDVSCFVFEPVQGANGYVPIDSEWLTATVAAARRAGVVVVADEIQAGYYRHGHLSPTRALGIDADIHLFSKSMTNGLYPLSAVVYPKAFDASAGSALALAHTFQTGVLGFRAAMAVAAWLDQGSLDELVSEVSEALALCAKRLGEIPAVHDVHTTGPALSFGHARAREVVRGCVRRHVLPFTGGAAGDRIRVAPPLTIPREQLADALDVLVHEVEQAV
ncbi:aminotransferase class III-fold pyridoxal phosphate-dependent enzyme [Streptomyces sp. NPDC048269]|uniref:aminotransferase class III-fold pyridoxal phosphate-dependent enzyme n=1 Tax=Streptomyces sp. NPDC048269 TaxID=3155753 RepID=UPI00343FED73